jgi:penicillin-binding protein 1C
MRKRFFFILILFLCSTEAGHALPTYEEVRQSYVKSDSLLLDRRGEVLHELRTDKVRRRLDWTSIKNISPALKVAVVKAEDKRFYEHPGFDYKSMGAAVLKGLTSESLRGASTITMQLASLLNRELQARKERRSIWQKRKQVVEAWEIEKGWSKQEIAGLPQTRFRRRALGISA